MRRAAILAVLTLAGSAGLAVATGPSSLAQDTPAYRPLETVEIRTINERALTYYVERPEAGRVPLLLDIDGSGCAGQLRSGSEWLAPGPDGPAPYARVRVEKAGVDPRAEHGSPCTDEFRKHYTLDGRVTDHLRVLQHLRATADWWDGTLLVFGWSDGGDIAGQLVSYYPGVTRAVLGAMGGGYTMEEHFRDFWVCPEGTEDRAACLASLDAQFTQMADNPTWTRTWSGEDNAWRVWPTRLYARLTVLLADDPTPKLIVHGAEDFESTPVESARRLHRELEAAGSDAHAYWEVPGMAHGWGGDFPDDKAEALERAIREWLLTGRAREEDLALLEIDPR